ncbi:type III polyketide synthase [Adhaeribacter soli]|uniref:Type III polyketide synthase n=1 Tax=Adhaeribacter soli TaxID=2607655 RepID=A0A5N1IIC3_9BACT|nr:type III polyketide synthase [Adhaeribacter soli]KAA9325029.1 type III polyketide synthase [Adhaeribacter soli]
MKSYLCAVGTANPDHKIPQMQASGFMADVLQFDAAEARKLAALYRVSGIENRYTVLEDYTRGNGSFEFFPNTADLEPFPQVAPRMQVYREQALPLSLKAIQNCLESNESLDLQQVTHLVTVSCTGMYAPGLDIEIIESLSLPTTIERTSVNFMGCYAAFNALKLANTICRSQPEANVLVVCTELCSLHFQKSKEHDHLVSNALFGDGAAAAWVSGKAPKGVSLAFEAFHCELMSSGKKDMAWHIGNFGFEMTLSAYIPDLIKKGIRQLSVNLLSRLNLDLPDIKWFAIHPGGRKILEAIEQELGIGRAENRFSYAVLRDYGNMSSATVLFVIKEVMKSLGPENDGERVLSFAFGPGLTMESMLLKINYV